MSEFLTDYELNLINGEVESGLGVGTRTARALLARLREADALLDMVQLLVPIECERQIAAYFARAKGEA